MGWVDNFVRSKVYKEVSAKLYGIGASVVIVGALFKINHWPGGTIMLIIGMGIEAVIFFVSAFEPLHVTYDWQEELLEVLLSEVLLDIPVHKI